VATRRAWDQYWKNSGLYLPPAGGFPRRLRHHNVESTFSSAARPPRWIRCSLLICGISRLTRPWRPDWCDLVALNVAVSRQIAPWLERIAPASRVTIVPKRRGRRGVSAR